MVNYTTRAPESCETTPLTGNRRGLSATIRIVLTGGAGLVADGYDLQVINLVTAILAHLYPTGMDASGKSFCTSMTFTGVVLGQLIFGTLADIIGRKLAGIATASLTLIGALASSMCTTSMVHFPVSTQLGLCRLVLGLGIGGEYPLSAAISKESSNGRDNILLCKETLLVVNMIMYNIGFFCQALLVVALVDFGVSLETVWRVSLACGMIPSLAALWCRLQMEEPMQQHSNTGSSSAWDGVGEHLNNIKKTIGPQWPVLVGACLSWCVFNFTAYGQGSFSAIICERFFGKPGATTVEIIHQDAVFALVCSLCGFAGNFLSLLLLQGCHLQFMQSLGFVGMAISVWLCCLLWGRLHLSEQWVIMLIYFTWNALQAIVGVTTYMVPAQSFASEGRASACGIAAASGKIGAAFGTAFFPVTEARLGLKKVLVGCGFLNIAGFLITLLLTPAIYCNAAAPKLVSDKSDPENCSTKAAF